MKAKEKAFELFNKYYQYDIIIIGTESEFEERGISAYDAKKLALICIDEILQSNPTKNNSYDYGESNEFYWHEVKTELEKL